MLIAIELVVLVAKSTIRRDHGIADVLSLRLGDRLTQIGPVRETNVAEVVLVVRVRLGDALFELLDLFLEAELALLIVAGRVGEDVVHRALVLPSLRHVTFEFLLLLRG